jgi:hypothetical protein
MQEIKPTHDDMSKGLSCPQRLSNFFFPGKVSSKGLTGLAFLGLTAVSVGDQYQRCWRCLRTQNRCTESFSEIFNSYRKFYLFLYSQFG